MAESRIIMGIGAALGCAGLVLTALGIAQLSQRAKHVTPEKAASPAQVETLHVPERAQAIEVAKLEREIAQLRREQQKRLADPKANFRCINGEWIERNGNSYQNHGACH